MNAHRSIPVRISDPFEHIDALDDAVEAAWEALRAECLEEFEDWVRADYDKREFADFSNWMVSKASWNRPNKYECALNFHERKLVGRAA
jgi:hypothetical protein